MEVASDLWILQSLKLLILLPVKHVGTLKTKCRPCPKNIHSILSLYSKQRDMVNSFSGLIGSFIQGFYFFIKVYILHYVYQI